MRNSSQSYANTLNLLGLAFEMMGNERLALEYLNEALGLFRQELGDDHLKVTAILSTIEAVK